MDVDRPAVSALDFATLQAGVSARCPGCASADVREVRPVRDREYGVDFVASYAVCKRCGTVRQSPMPSGSMLAGFYPPNYHAQTGRGLLNRIRQEMRLRHLRPFFDGDGAILDFACGNGAFLRHCAQRVPGRRYFGFEIGDRREVLEDEGITIVKGQLADLMDILPACRLITMNHAIEHLPDPRTTVATLVAKLMPRGVFEGQTPAAGSLEHRVFGDDWSGYHAPRHTVVFSSAGLQRFLDGLGLTEVKVSGAFNPAGLAVSLASVRHRSSGAPIDRTRWPWLIWVALGTALAPLDLLYGPPGIQNFIARRPEA